jgi:hypothetical protein
MNGTIRINRRILWTVVAAIVLVLLALLCWAQISRSLNPPLYMQLGTGVGHAGLPRPAGGSGTVTSYEVATIEITLTHLSPQLQWMIAGDWLLKYVQFAAAALTIGVVWVRTSAGRPFARSVTWSLIALAVVVAVVGSAQEVLESFIGTREAFEAIGSGSQTYYSASPTFQFTGGELLIAGGIFLIASAFAIGARLTRDTEGLV